MTSDLHQPPVTVIVPFFNAERYLGPCLERLSKQHYPAEKYEIIAVDNDSTDNGAAIVKKYNVKYLLCRKRGPAAARNCGIKRATGEIIIFIDADCLADAHLIANHVKRHVAFREKDVRVKMVGGGIGGYNKNFWAICDDICSWDKFHPRLFPRYITDFFPSSNMSISKKYIMKIGNFNENLFYSEDVALCKKVFRDGSKIFFAPEAKVEHINRTTFSGFLLHAKEWTGGHLVKLKEGIAGPVRFPFLYYTLGSVFLAWRTVFFCFLSYRFYSLLLMPLIFLNQFLKSMSLLRMEIEFKALRKELLIG